LSELDPLLREAFLLKYIEELSYEEMSALTGVGVSALKMRVKRASDRLRERWERIKHD
jgi:RNA polymerase sigma-70 factor (ECF subfamily)